jgi:hypothetical protein
MRASACYIYIVIGLLLDIEPQTGLKIHKKGHLGSDARGLAVPEIVPQAGVEIQIQASDDSELDAKAERGGILHTVHTLMEVGAVGGCGNMIIVPYRLSTIPPA